MSDERTITFTNALRQAGLRLTPQRLAICRALANHPSHPTAAELFEQLRADFPTLSLATVYTTLSTLLALGLIHDLGSAGDGTLHYDPDTEPHVNLICTRCHQISDLGDETLAAVSQRVARRSGYEILGARIAYYGICPTCAKHSSRGASGRR